MVPIVRAVDVNAILDEDHEAIEYLKQRPQLLELVKIVSKEVEAEAETEADEGSEEGKMIIRKIIQPRTACISSRPLLTLEFGDGGLGGDTGEDQMVFKESDVKRMTASSKELAKKWHQNGPDKKRRMLKYASNPLGKHFRVVGMGPYFGELKRTSEMKESLVPIRLDIETDGYKLLDTFVWNASDTVVTPDLFAKVLCSDLQLPEQIMKTHIVEAIENQLNEHKATAVVTPAVGDHQDKRVLIKLNVRVGIEMLEDQFEWDLTDPNNNPGK